MYLKPFLNSPLGQNQNCPPLGLSLASDVLFQTPRFTTLYHPSLHPLTFFLIYKQSYVCDSVSGPL